MAARSTADADFEPAKTPKRSVPTHRITLVICILETITIIALAIGLGIGLDRRHSCINVPDQAEATPATDRTSSTPTKRSSKIWQPTPGTTWQIELQDPLANSKLNVAVYDIDLFNNTAATVSTLHAQNKKVICYFSAGSYEDWSPDHDRFDKSTIGNPLKDWPGEWWLDTNSKNVRKLMSDRLDLAVQKGCDGVDPDNVDAYDNDNGLNLKVSDAVAYVTFLATEAQARNLSIGLKNAGTILPQVESLMQWAVNEQCVEYDECELFESFIQHGKPVFHVEYPESAPSISMQDVDKFCNPKGFSTVLKKLNLDEWVYECAGS
ncbi:MAG: hypothetical protein LQ350_003466 [Teloschistes chrysophthalmus]|nr:MAG: hypothetical protein LQ350_003466 [Niorma chrysophthalma]